MTLTQFRRLPQVVGNATNSDAALVAHCANCAHCAMPKLVAIQPQIEQIQTLNAEIVIIHPFPFIQRVPHKSHHMENSICVDLLHCIAFVE